MLNLNQLEKIIVLNQSLSLANFQKLCNRWKIREIAVFGSILREDFNSDSDLDLLVTFFEDAQWSLWDIVKLKTEFKNLLGREVDLVEKSSLSNPFIRYEILTTKQTIYESNQQK